MLLVVIEVQHETGIGMGDLRGQQEGGKARLAQPHGAERQRHVVHEPVVQLALAPRDLDELDVRTSQGRPQLGSELLKR